MAGPDQPPQLGVGHFQPDSGNRMRHLAHVRALDMPALDYTEQTFYTPALPGARVPA